MLAPKEGFAPWTHWKREHFKEVEYIQIRTWPYFLRSFSKIFASMVNDGSALYVRHARIKECTS